MPAFPAIRPSTRVGSQAVSPARDSAEPLRALRRLTAFTLTALLGACSGFAPPEAVGPPAKEEIVAVTVSNHLLRFNAGQPQVVRERRPLKGLRPAERLLGVDYRVARGELYALGASGQLYRIDVARATATSIGAPTALPETGEWGFDFNPVVDRIRVVSDQGVNLRLHPDTGAMVDGDGERTGVQPDGALVFDETDANAGRPARIAAAAYTYNKSDSKITTNYAIDGGLGLLVHQGTREGVAPSVSPNSGRLYTVGTLGIGSFEHATLDVSDLSNTAYAGVRHGGQSATRWHRIDLATGKASYIGTVAGGEALVGAAIEP